MKTSDTWSWIAETTRLAVYGWLRFAAIFIGLTVIGLAFSRELPGGSVVSTVLLLSGLAVVCFVAAWTYSATRSFGRTGLGYHARWVVSGMLAGGLFMGLPMLSPRWSGGNPGLDPVLWVGFWSLVGGVTAYAYGRMAQDWAD